MTCIEKLTALRTRLRQNRLDGFLVPRADRFQNEYVPASDERLAWLLGFTGSAGLALVLQNRVVLFVDGRYTVQAAQQTDSALVECVQIGAGLSYQTWLSENLAADSRIGYDAWLHSQAQIQSFSNACDAAGAQLLATENWLDALWEAQPAAPQQPVVPHPLAYAGQTSAEKLTGVARQLRHNGVDATVLTATDSVAWLFNLRGNDIPYNPVFGAYALVDAAGSAELFLAAERLIDHSALPDSVTLRDPGDFVPTLEALGQAQASLQLDYSRAAAAIVSTLQEAGAMVVHAADPCVLPKAVKSTVEAEGARQAHLRDGVAVTKFLYWLDQRRPAKTTELAVAEQLRQTRVAVAEQFSVELKDLSFNTISAVGENAALPHYSATVEHNSELTPTEIYLVDSGGQYLDGTTDITRTVILDDLPSGDLGAEMRDRYTRVLKGHSSLALARFPKGTSGNQLDAIARYALWQGGYDFDHGTGHGVGSYLCVHEGPQNISPRPNNQALLPGMIVSNEPGYYKAGHYGIRIENLVLVVELEAAERPMLGFETLTLAPIDRRLIDAEMLTTAERGWLNRYHARVYKALAPHLTDAEQAWLQQATAEI